MGALYDSSHSSTQWSIYFWTLYMLLLLRVLPSTARRCGVVSLCNCMLLHCACWCATVCCCTVHTGGHTCIGEGPLNPCLPNSATSGLEKGARLNFMHNDGGLSWCTVMLCSVMNAA